MNDSSAKSRRELILGNVDDLVADFLYYDRRYDVDLPRGAIDEAVKVGEVSIDEIVDAFRQALTEGVAS